MGNTQITLNEEAGRLRRSTSNKSSKPCEVAQYPQQTRYHTHNKDTLSFSMSTGRQRLTGCLIFTGLFMQIDPTL